MQYALIDNLKIAPQKGLTGFCPACSKEVTAKCGDIKAHHWAHVNNKDCDTWSEPETQWHVDWKNKFHQDYREIPFQDPINKEWHRADVHTANGITIEFQNSPINIEELSSRDTFYEKLIWVVNGMKFKHQFNLTRSIPNPSHKEFDDIIFLGVGIYSLKSTTTISRGLISSFLLGDNSPEIKGLFDSVKQEEAKYWLYTWKNKHKVWHHSNSPIFIDFGDDFLYRLKSREQLPLEPLNYVQIVRKFDFLNKYSV